MNPSGAYESLFPNEKRERALQAMRQPMTATQLAARSGIPFRQCKSILAVLTDHRVIRCLNSEARQSRVYWFTPIGLRLQQEILVSVGLPLPQGAPAKVDWDLYGWVCYRHRSAVLRALREPLQPAEIKRVARSQNGCLTMSANNVRDVIRLFLERGLVRRIQLRKKRHPRYELTDTGAILRQLLCQAAEVGP